MELDKIRDRILQCADYYIKHKSTVRDTAKKFNISKTTVHDNFINELKRLDISRYEAVRKILDENKKYRHIKGGLATKKRNNKNS